MCLSEETPCYPHRGKMTESQVAHGSVTQACESAGPWTVIITVTRGGHASALRDADYRIGGES